MSQSGFTNTFILEANRLSSEEVKGGNKTNNALFTNKVHDGLRLDTGDVVSVHSAYISELGAEGSDIQIKGVDIDPKNASQVLEYNEIRYNSDIEENVTLRKTDKIVNGFPLSRRVNTSSVIKYRDDEINLVMNPYKNANGEFYIPLPYNYSQPTSTAESPFVEDITAWLESYHIEPNMASSASKTFGDTTKGNITKYPLRVCWNKSDKKEYKPKFNTDDINICNKHDNSRYSLYQLKECIHLFPLETDDAQYTDIRDSAIQVIAETNACFTNASYQYGLREDGKSGNPHWRDIATFPYVRVQNKVNASVSAGYNSNTDIASKITEDLLRTEEIDIKTYDGDVITTTAQTQVNKTYNCATIGSYDPLGWGYFNQVPGKTDGAVGDAYINRYIEAHNTIGVKRPDLYDLGREFMGTSPEGYELRFDFHTTGPGGSQNACNVGGLLYTNIPWSKVEDLKNLVDAQRRYPELFDVSNINGSQLNFNKAYLQPNSSYSFFLHINTTHEHKYLGYDLNDNNSSYWGDNITGQDYNTTPSYKLPSVPIWFDINSTTDGIPEGSVATGQDFDSAVYGFAVKTYDTGGNPLIGLRSSNHVNKYDIEIDSNYDRYKKGTKIGWDRHFTAYGCPCMILWNGFCGLSGAGYEGMGITGYVNEDAGAGLLEVKFSPAYINNIYVGSQNVVMAFEPEDDRFEIRNLHTSERIGNLYNAGYTGEDKYEETNASGIVTFTNPDVAVPVNPNADSNVYKLNKQLLRTNFTPAMAPYNSERNASFYTRYTDTNQASYTAKQRIEYFNPNFEKNTIYDSMCGNYITDWGVNEKYWNQSLLGIMGFRYSQTTGSGNSQTRVINSVSWGDSFEGMNENTTNADITNADFHNLPRNMFNSPMFSLHPPVPQIPRFEDWNSNASHTYLPPVSITQDKGQPLRAVEIPTRTLRPYYTIRSNIVGQSRYLGSGDSSIPLPVVAIVEKVSQSGDFFNLTGSDMSFTITQPTTLSDIRTSIHDPDGSYSRVSPNSAVLYKIEKQVRADMNPVSTILQGLNKKKAEEFEESLEPPQPTQKDIINLVAEMVVKNN